MIAHYLRGAVDDIKLLSQITAKDIEDIKEARHEKLFERTKTKEDLIASFENKKAIIDNEIGKLSKNNPNTPIQELLESSAALMLDELRNSLKELKEQNKNFARMVLAVSEFYNSLLEKLIPSEKNGYEQTRRSSSFLQVRA